TRVHYTPDAAYRVAREIAEIRPDAVITWGQAWQRGMRHPDHQATGDIVRAALTIARMRRAVAPLEPHRGDCPVFTLREPHSTLPELAIDIAACRRRRSRSLRTTVSGSAGRTTSGSWRVTGLPVLRMAWRRPSCSMRGRRRAAWLPR